MVKVTRIGSNKNLQHEGEIVDVVINGVKYRLTESFGTLKIHCEESIVVKGGYSNEIEVKQMPNKKFYEN